MPRKLADEPRVVALSDLQPPTEPIRPFSPAEALVAAQKLHRHLDAWHVEDHLGKRYVDDYGAEVAKRERFRDIVLRGEHRGRPAALNLRQGLTPPGAGDGSQGAAFIENDDPADKSLTRWLLRDFHERLLPHKSVREWQALVLAWENLLDEPCQTLRAPHPGADARWAADHAALWIVVGRHLHPSLGADLVQAAQLVATTTSPWPTRTTGNRRGRPKKSEKDSAAKVIAALILHHQYTNGSVENYEPASNRGLAALVNKNLTAGQPGLSANALTRFLHDKFPREEKPMRKYMIACQDRTIGMMLTLWNGEMPTHAGALLDDEEETSTRKHGQRRGGRTPGSHRDDDDD